MAVGTKTGKRSGAIAGKGTTALVLTLVLAAPGMAQEPPTSDPQVPGVDRPTSLSVWKGPPGTQVTVKGEYLPAITPVHVALGGTRAGFEALTLALTSRWGELEETVEVPEWARRDRAHRFIIFDAYFAPLATTALFHVTDADGSILRIGRVAEITEGCVAVNGEDDERYSVEGGGLEGVSVGDRVEFDAVILDATPCAGGIPVVVREFLPLASSRTP